jgi:hypothetical protein
VIPRLLLSVARGLYSVAADTVTYLRGLADSHDVLDTDDDNPPQRTDVFDDFMDLVRMSEAQLTEALRIETGTR